VAECPRQHSSALCTIDEEDSAALLARFEVAFEMHQVVPDSM